MATEVVNKSILNETILEDMKENYGLCFDERQFFVDYRSYGSNMLPEVTILKKGS